MANNTTIEKKLDTNHIKEICKELDLTLFTGQEWFDYIEIINKEANGVYNFDKDGLSFIDRLLQEHNQV